MKRKLTHLDDEGNLSMVDVGSKNVTDREAIASAIVRMSKGTLDLVVKEALPKGDVLNTARVAGILSAKQTPALIPLTHSLPLSYVDVSFQLNKNEGSIEITSTVRCTAKTGVEIEAMTACSIAALTIYDMCKGAEKGIVIESIQLESKTGGKSGTYKRGG